VLATGGAAGKQASGKGGAGKQAPPAFPARAALCAACYDAEAAAARAAGGGGAAGVISSTLHRDDFGSRGMAAGTDPTKLPFAIDGSHILLIDDVLYTGRTIRAALNELYDFGRPASVRLAVLVDRGGRELPIEAAFAAARVMLPASHKLRLTRDDSGRFDFSVQEQT